MCCDTKHPSTRKRFPIVSGSVAVMAKVSAIDPVVQGRRTQSISAIVPPLDRKVLPLFLDKVIMLYARDVHDKPF